MKFRPEDLKNLLSWAELARIPPGRLHLLYAGRESFVGCLEVATPEGGITGSAEFLHDLSSGRGEMSFEDLRLDIDILHFSEAFAEWPYEWDVTSGTWQIEGDVSWEQTASGFAYEGRSLHVIDSLAGSFRDTGFLGFSTIGSIVIGLLVSSWTSWSG